MKRHKWKDTSSTIEKSSECEKCGMIRDWQGGDMQCWEYFDPRTPFNTNRTTLNRPECEPDRIITEGFPKKFYV